METRALLAIHAWSSPGLDRLFRLSHELGTLPFCAILVLAAAAWRLRRGETREAWLWIVVGVSTYAVQESLKHLVGRPRPSLWPPLVPQSGFSFPSGHALAAATFYPLLARAWARARPGDEIGAWGIAILLALFIGFGRLYLGVHWPTDVLAGWALGAAQTAATIHLAQRRG
jgi:undecaprenyl-diphosphatase